MVIYNNRMVFWAHIIVDYSFWGLNDETLKRSHQEAMQFGRALERIIAKVVLADPRYGPVKLIKIDIADGIYRIRVHTEDIPKLGIAFPHKEGEAPLVAFRLVLPMGWTESPPYLCSATETVTDIAHDHIAKWRNPPVHRLELDTQVDVTEEEQPSVTTTSPQLGALEVPTDRDPVLVRRRARQLAYIDVFFDDFLGAAQGNMARLNRVRRILMDSIDLVFRPLGALPYSPRADLGQEASARRRHLVHLQEATGVDHRFCGDDTHYAAASTCTSVRALQRPPAPRSGCPSKNGTVF
jgi:hypothetical protein